MSKKDFELIIKMIKNACVNLEEQQFIPSMSKGEVMDSIAETFSDTLSDDYPKFDEDKFLLAFGIGKEETIEF